MNRVAFLFLAAAGIACALPADNDVVFRSDVSLVRVDAQVVDRDNRAVTGLHADDFVLLEEGKPQPIRNFTRENMPVDVLLLFDVSASMRPHVERIASAGHEALSVLGNNDRVAIMVFDRSTRVRLAFRNNRDDVEREFQSMLRQENFNGGTDITRALLDAAKYIGREGRPDARRAIVIVTDDQTERNRDEEAVERALTQSNAVLCALIAPDAMRTGSHWPGSGGGRGGGGGGWPGGGGSVGMGGPLGGIIFGRRGGYGRRGPGGGGGMGPHTKSAGTSEIARESGGDSMPVDQASAFEDTLSRLRQRYALHFYLPPGVKPGQERNVEVQLADTARWRYPEAEVHYRRVYVAPDGSVAPANTNSEPVVVSRAPADSASSTAGDTEESSGKVLKRRPAVNEPGGAGPMMPSETPGAAQARPSSQTPQGGWPRAGQSTQPSQPAPKQDTAPADDTSHGGWPRVKPGE